MHKRLYNEAFITLTIAPDGPILIKAGETGADPTRPDMEFVRTHQGGQEVVYLPGPSLKGVIRAHCERIARTVGGDKLSCNPVDERASCSGRLEKKKLTGAQVYHDSCFICQLFGNTSLAGHLRLADAYPLGQVKLEERNGVAIDRVFGSVAVGPFNYEVCVEGQFQTTIQVRNFTVAQLGLLALALRDLAAGRVRIGFGKSRGLGRVHAAVDEVRLQYPLCQVEDGFLKLLGREDPVAAASELPGAGAFLNAEERRDYGYPADDRVALPAGLAYGPGEAELRMTDPAAIEVLWRACAPRWGEVVST